MKYFTFLILLLFFAISAIGQIDYPDSGFTNKTEAKNLMVNGFKEGKWVEYFMADGVCYPTDTNADLYNLTVYKRGERFGVLRTYYKNGKLGAETPYVNNEINGLAKEYYENGKLRSVVSFLNDKINEIKEFYENGKLKSETVYSNGLMGLTKNYDENGNEIK